jgi:hypothetical protein
VLLLVMVKAALLKVATTHRLQAARHIHHQAKTIHLHLIRPDSLPRSNLIPLHLLNRPQLVKEAIPLHRRSSSMAITGTEHHIKIHLIKLYFP